MMKFVNGFCQQKAVEFGLSLNELAVLKWFALFQNTGRMTTTIYQNNVYYLVSYNKVIQDLPILGVTSKKSISRIFDNLVQQKILDKCVHENRMVFFRLSDNYIYLIAETENSNTANDGQPNKNNQNENVDGGCKKMSEWGESNLSTNNKINNNKIKYNNTVLSDSKTEVVYTDKTDENISLNNQEEIKDIDNNIRYASSKAKVDNNKDNINKITQKSFIGRGDFLRLTRKFGKNISSIALKWCKDTIQNPENYDIDVLEFTLNRLVARAKEKYEDNQRQILAFIIKALKQGAYFYDLHEGFSCENETEINVSQIKDNTENDLQERFINDLLLSFKETFCNKLSDVKPKEV